MSAVDTRRAAREAEKKQSGGRWAVLGAVGLFVVGGAGLWTVTAGDGGEAPASCDSTIRISVATTPEIGQVLEQKPVSSESCVRLDVVEQPSSETAQRAAPDQLAEPLWIPDSSGRVDESGFDGAVEAHTPSLASSPAVVVSRQGSEDLPATWTELVADEGTRMGDPDADGGAQAAMQSVTAESQTGASDREEAQAALTSRAHTQGVTSPVLDAPQLIEAVEQDGGRSIVAEHSLLRHGLPSDLQAGTPESGASFLDYPLMVTSGALSSSDSVQTAADEITEWFGSEEGRRALAEAGLRTADGTPVDDEHSLEVAHRLRVPDRAAFDEVAETYERQSMPLNALAVVDASGSMGERDSDGRTRWESTMSTVSVGSQLFPARDELGLWLFSHDMGPHGEPYEVLEPVRGVEEEVAEKGGRTQRELLQEAAADAQYEEGGQTELYETTLAAFHQQQADWQEGHLNAVILLSDGGQQVYGDEDPMRIEDLVAALQEEQDPARPVRIMTLGISEDADEVALGAIAGVTGGSYHSATNEQEIQEAFMEGLATVDR